MGTFCINFQDLAKARGVNKEPSWTGGGQENLQVPDAVKEGWGPENPKEQVGHGIQ